MSEVYSIKGLLNWVKKPEWADWFAEIIEEHYEDLCLEWEIPAGRLPEIIGDAGMSNLWGAAFEDLASTHYDDQVNICDDYLKRRGWKESPGVREYIGALRDSEMSLYEITNVIPGESVMARDLVRGGEPVRVYEKNGSHFLAQWDGVAARVVTVRGKTGFTGVILPLDKEACKQALEDLNEIARSDEELAKQFAKERALKQGEPRAARPGNIKFRAVDILHENASIFSNAWLESALQKLLHPQSPVVKNKDGDEFQLINVRYPLSPPASADAIRSALDAHPQLSAKNASLWQWIRPADTNAPAKPASADNINTSTQLDTGSLILGTIELRGKALMLSVNSHERAVQGRKLLEPALPGWLGTPLTEVQTVAQAIADARKTPDPPGLPGLPGARPSGLPPEVERSILQNFQMKHYRDTLDSPLPILGGKSPRQAVKTKKGREDVISWLKYLENNNTRRPANAQLASFDYSWMWAELGLEAERK